MKQVDMSEKGILSRLRQTDKLRKLCLTLMKAKKVKDEKLNKEDLEQIKESAKITK